VLFPANSSVNNFMKNYVRMFLKSDEGQDILEYTLLLAFVGLASAALYIGAGGSINGIWSKTNSELNAAAISAAN